MRLRKKKSLLDQASEYVEQVRPQVEAAVAQAFEAVEDFVESTALPALADAREKAGPALVDAHSRAIAGLADARDKAAPVVADARAKAVPLIATGAALAGEKASAVKEMADAKVAQLKGEQAPKKSSTWKKVALLAGVAAAVGFAAKKLQGGSDPDDWQSSYVPSPSSPASAAATEPTSPVTAVPTAGTEEDPGGASPGEAIADQVEAPHAVTTPDEPVEVVPLDDPKP